jgi:hypothetical protein
MFNHPYSLAAVPQLMDLHRWLQYVTTMVALPHSVAMLRALESAVLHFPSVAAFAGCEWKAFILAIVTRRGLHSDESMPHTLLCSA